MRRHSSRSRAGGPRKAIGLRLAAAGLSMLLAGLASARPMADPPPPDGPGYRVSRFNLRYLHGGHPGHPSRDELMQLEIDLGRGPDGYVAPRAGVPSETIRLADLTDERVETYRASAVQAILERLQAFLAGRQLIGIYVAPDPTQISPSGEDLRPPGRTTLRIVITTALVSGVRTLAYGDRVDPAERINHPAHRRIIEHSPLKPFVEVEGSGKGRRKRRDLLRRDHLDDYLFRLSRHAGRRVDAAVSAGDEAGMVTLDYLVTERSPLVLYAELSNTGTPSTDRLRQRFGIVHTQLTNNDDVLALDYRTAAFDTVNAIVGSYEAPFGKRDDLRWRVYGSWSEFTASELGFFDDVFTGEAFTVGGEILWTIYQRDNLFVDLLAGFRFEQISVDNEVIDVSGQEEFHLPHFGLRFDKSGAWYHLLGSLVAEWNDGQSPRPERTELNRLGRLFPDPEFGVLRWDLSASVYLEPFLDRAAWDDLATPESSTLAHEVALGFRGQYAFDNRLIPQYQQVVGGLHSVRGYPESVVAGDTALIGSIEYRYHLPRALTIEPTPGSLFGKPFRFAPQRVHGQTDWDLVLRAFFDVGRTFVNDELFFEREDTLLGAGVGLELELRGNVSVRLDWGFALRELEEESVDAGSNRLQFVTRIFF